MNFLKKKLLHLADFRAGADRVNEREQRTDTLRPFSSVYPLRKGKLSQCHWATK